MKKIEILIVCIALLAIACVVCGCEEEPEYKTSEYSCAGGFIWPISRILVENGIIRVGESIDFSDPQEKELRIMCPMCGIDGASIELKKNCIIIKCFTTKPISLGTINAGESKEISLDFSNKQMYCGKCYYPLGTDWKIIDLTKIEEAED